MCDGLIMIAAKADEELKRIKGAAEGIKPLQIDGESPKMRLSSLIKLADVADPLEAEPIRTVHHFSCSGGTLIIKCLAAMPNVLVLNEIDPHSRLPTRYERANFTPTDLISLLRQGDRNLSPELIDRLFMNAITIIREQEWHKGGALLLRDHSHSHYLFGPEVSDRPTLLARLVERFPVRSLLTVRDPVDSFLSMQANGWSSHFTPSSFSEYCSRYLRFLDDHATVTVLKYEEFVQRPKTIMRKMCRLLNLRFNPDFDQMFNVFAFSGDSGRKSAEIADRPRRPLPDLLVREARASIDYAQLTDRLSYERVGSW